MHVPAGVWVFTVIISILVIGLTLWVTRKAYSKKWEGHPDSDAGGEEGRR